MRTLEGLRGAAQVTVDGSVVVRSAGAPATLETRFPIASAGKQFAAVAALLLAERGKLALDRPVAPWLPGCPPWWREVTLHHLLTHTSGLPHWGAEPGFDVRAAMPVADRVGLIPQGTPASRPGLRWLYSSPGYLLVAHIVEQAAGQPYGDFLAEHIFAPLGMSATTTGRPAVGAAAGEALPPMAGTSDVWSTVGDLARYSEQIHSGALLGFESRAAMTGPLTATAAEPRPGRTFFAPHYGYGLFVGTVGGHLAYFHPGDIPGFASFTAWLPERRASVVLLTDDEHTDLHAMTRQLLTSAALS
ncbi:serine hydrolase domain-containing protein [Actinoplanes sp. NPDC049599]|uniref:serine hydrolase domain-containing protein n=1 Tax=Actinoplanes sp. NPDC049599 TaxID=3363903 RepID=UPI00378E970D